jgi:hypothetical protein
MPKISELNLIVPEGTPRHKSRFTCPKPPFKAKQVWIIRTRLQVAKRTRDIALFDIAQSPALNWRCAELRREPFRPLRRPDISLDEVCEADASIAGEIVGADRMAEIGPVSHAPAVDNAGIAKDRAQQHRNSS